MVSPRALARGVFFLDYMLNLIILTHLSMGFIFLFKIRGHKVATFGCTLKVPNEKRTKGGTISTL